MQAAGKPFALIGVNVSGTPAEQLKGLMTQNNLPWRTFVDSGPAAHGEIATRWNLLSTPTLYLLDADGVVRHKWLGGAAEKTLDDSIEKLLRDVEEQQ